MKKSNLDPNRKCKYLGFNLDSQNMSVQLPIVKKARLINQINQMENRKICLIREFAKFIGSLVSNCSGVEYDMIHSKSLERTKLKALDGNHIDFDRKMKIPAYIKDNLNWWKRHLKDARKQIKMMDFRIEIFTDASMIG